MPATLTARKGKKSKASKKKFLSYDQIRSICEKPQDKRKELPIGRGGAMTAPRKFHLAEDEVEKLLADRAENGKGDRNYVPNPHNKGFYHFAVETLKALGVNRPHSDPVTKAKFKELTNVPATKDASGRTFWQRWKNKDSAAKNSDNALDWEGRFEQNMEVMQRLGGLHPYGLKLKEVGPKVMKTKGVVIDILKSSKGDKQYQLNTNSDTPRNEFRVRGAMAVAAEQPRKAAKRVAKGTTKTRKAPAAASSTQASGESSEKSTQTEAATAAE
jgi:hypothetical protein